MRGLEQSKGEIATTKNKNAAQSLVANFKRFYT